MHGTGGAWRWVTTAAAAALAAAAQHRKCEGGSGRLRASLPWLSTEDLHVAALFRCSQCGHLLLPGYAQQMPAWRFRSSTHIKLREWRCKMVVQRCWRRPAPPCGRGAAQVRCVLGWAIAHMQVAKFANSSASWTSCRALVKAHGCLIRSSHRYLSQALPRGRCPRLPASSRRLTRAGAPRGGRRRQRNGR
jgi:hypothetical protein